MAIILTGGTKKEMSIKTKTKTMSEEQLISVVEEEEDGDIIELQSNDKNTLYKRVAGIMKIINNNNF